MRGSVALDGERKPIRASLLAGCARAARCPASTAPPRATVRNRRRFMPRTVGHSLPRAQGRSDGVILIRPHGHAIVCGEGASSGVFTVGRVFLVVLFSLATLGCSN